MGWRAVDAGGAPPPQSRRDRFLVERGFVICASKRCLAQRGSPAVDRVRIANKAPTRRCRRARQPVGGTRQAACCPSKRCRSASTRRPPWCQCVGRSIKGSASFQRTSTRRRETRCQMAGPGASIAAPRSPPATPVRSRRPSTGAKARRGRAPATPMGKPRSAAPPPRPAPARCLQRERWR